MALSGGLGGPSGARRTHMVHTYPLPGSVAPKGALRPQHARFLHAHPNGFALVSFIKGMARATGGGTARGLCVVARMGVGIWAYQRPRLSTCGGAVGKTFAAIFGFR